MAAVSGEVAELAELPAVLVGEGVADFAASFAPHLVRPGAWKAATREAPPTLRAAINLLMLNVPTPIEQLPAGVAAAVPLLVQAGVCTVDRSGTAHFGDLVLYYVQGLFVFAQRPQPLPGPYVADDAVGLATHLPARPGYTLDLLAGPAVQSLVCAQRGGQVVATEVNPMAGALARINVALNGMGDRVSVRFGNLYSPLGDARFDTIIAKAVHLPIPESVSYPSGGSGGPDGLRAARPILAGLPDHLKRPGGQGLMIGLLASDGRFPLAYGELRAFAAEHGLDLTLTVTGHAPAGGGSHWAGAVSRNAATYGGDPHALRAQLIAGYRDDGVSHIAPYVLRVTPGGGALRYLDLSGAGSSGWSWVL